VPGSLHRSLGAFATRGLNMSRLESRPWTGRAARWEYLFWVDLDADPASPACAEALEALAAETELVRILGTFPRAAED
jgi:prephenate dehydratase